MSKTFNRWWGIPIGFGSGAIFGAFGAFGSTSLIALSKKTRPAAFVTGVSSLVGWAIGSLAHAVLTGYAVSRFMKRDGDANEVSTSAQPEKIAATLPGAPALPRDPLIGESVTKQLSGFPYAGLMTPALDKWRNRNRFLLGRSIRIL